MSLGLMIDCASIPAEALASLCSVPGSWQATLALHWRTMPASNALMLIAGQLLASTVRFRQPLLPFDEPRVVIAALEQTLSRLDLLQ